MRYPTARRSIASALIALFSAGASAAQSPLYPVEQFAGPGSEFELIADDFDGDGRLDIVALSEFVAIADGAIYLHRGNGAGGFAPAKKIANLLEPRSGGAADINGDGAMDLVVAHDNSPPISTLAVFLGNGAGVFGPHVNYVAGAQVTAAALAAR